MGKPGPNWTALGRVFAGLGAASPAEPNATLPADLTGPTSDPELAREAAEERAAIMEYDGGLSRRAAEAQAYRAQGLKPP